MARSAPKDRPDGGADQADSTAAGSTASAAAASRASSEASSPAKPPPAAPAASASPPSPDPAPTRSASVARDSPPEKAKPAKRMVATRVEPTEAAAAAPPPARGDAEPGAYVSLCAKFLELRLAEVSRAGRGEQEGGQEALQEGRRPPARCSSAARGRLPACAFASPATGN